jgi:PAS domain S-box-containing protein
MAWETDLQPDNRRFRAVFDNATVGILVTDRQGRIVAANGLAEHIFGYGPGELTGAPIEVLVPPDVVGGHERLRESFYADPAVRAMGHGRDLHARRKDGTVFPAEISLSYFYEGPDLFAVAFVVDVTYLKQTEQELIAQKDRVERLNAELEEKVAQRTHALTLTLGELERSKNELAKALSAERELGELKSRFVSMASHEFRTPLSAVLTSTALIEKYLAVGPDALDKIHRHTQRIKASVNQLNDILEEFLSVGRLEEGKITVNPTPFDWAGLVDEVVADLHDLRKPDQVLRHEQGPSETVWLDKSLVRKIFVNLLSNAIKYSDPGTSIRLESACEGGEARFTVTDQGIGISEEDQRHLFERFFRARNAANHQGTGLGLHIVARYLDLLGGTISLKSALQEGTTITIRLPYENAAAD